LRTEKSGARKRGRSPPGGFTEGNRKPKSRRFGPQGFLTQATGQANMQTHRRAHRGGAQPPCGKRREACAKATSSPSEIPIAAQQASRSPTSLASGALISKGKVPSRLNAAINMRIALEGVVPICSVASKNRSFSCGDTLGDDRCHPVCHRRPRSPFVSCLGNTSYVYVIPSGES